MCVWHFQFIILGMGIVVVVDIPHHHHPTAPTTHPTRHAGAYIDAERRHGGEFDVEGQEPLRGAVRIGRLQLARHDGQHPV